MVKSGRLGWLALGISLFLHGLPVVLICLFSPGGSSHASVTAFAIDTRGGPPRSMHLSLWDESKSSPPKSPEASPASRVPAPVAAAAKALEQTQPVVGQQTPVEPAEFVVNNTANATSDYSPDRQRWQWAVRSRNARLIWQKRGKQFRWRRRHRLAAAAATGPERGIRRRWFVEHGEHRTGRFVERAKRELMAGIDALPATTRFQVIVYNRSPIRCTSMATPIWCQPRSKTSWPLSC